MLWSFPTSIILIFFGQVNSIQIQTRYQRSVEKLDIGNAEEGPRASVDAAWSQKPRLDDQTGNLSYAYGARKLLACYGKLKEVGKLGDEKQFR